MPKGIYQRGGQKVAVSFTTNQDGPAPMDAPTPTTAPKLVKMQLTRNYVPRGPFTIVGYDRPEIKAKDAAGREHIVQTAAFIEGEMAPPIHPGVGFVGKVWASTVIEVPEDEARDMRRLKIAEAVI